MKLITRDTDYAVRALCYIAKAKQRVVCVSDLVSRLKIPRPFLRKILQILNKEKILSSTKGKGGGFTLDLAPKKIFLLDLIKIFQGPLKINQCLFKKACCPHTDSCKLKRKIDHIEKYVVSELRNVTLVSMLKGAK